MSTPIKPDYYRVNNQDTLPLVQALDFTGGNVVKYIVRSCRLDGVTKGHVLEDLKKARYLLDRRIQVLEEEQG